MSQLSELVAMESQIRALRESIQKSYSTIKFENSELGEFVSTMVDNISQPECLRALVRLEQMVADNFTSLDKIDKGVALPQTGSTVICARFVDSYNTVCYCELIIDITLDDIVEDIYNEYMDRV